MSETIPSLLKKLKDAENTIRQLKERKQDTVVVNKIVPGPVQEKVVYYTDPAQEDMIRRLQERIRELESGD